MGLFRPHPPLPPMGEGVPSAQERRTSINGETIEATLKTSGFT
jgi:hypothetical protein